MATSYTPTANVYARDAKMDILNTWTEALSGATRLADRKWLIVNVKDKNKVYYSYASDTTVKNAYAIGGGESRSFPIGDKIPLYIRTGSGGARVIVEELA